MARSLIPLFIPANLRRFPSVVTHAIFSSLGSFSVVIFPMFSVVILISEKVYLNEPTRHLHGLKWISKQITIIILLKMYSIIIFVIQ